MAQVQGADGGLIVNELDKIVLTVLVGSTVLAIVAAVFVISFWL